MGLLIFVTIFSLPDAAQANNYQHKEQISQIIHEQPKAILDSVKNYQQQKQPAANQELALLPENLSQDWQTTIDKSPYKGNYNSQVLLLEFSDFQCPYCGQMQKTLQQFLANHQDEVTLVYKHYPLSSIHAQALPAAKAAWAAGQQGKFWQYHDILFSHQNQLSDRFYIQVAKQLGLELDNFQTDRNSQEAINAIEKDMKLADALGITGTPFFVMNDKKFFGTVPLSLLESSLAKFLVEE